MNGEPTDFEKLRKSTQDAINGDLGDEAQEEMIVKLFEGQLKHHMNVMTVWAGENVGSLGSKDNTIIWS